MCSITDVTLLPTGYERLLPPNTQMAVHTARRAVGRRLDRRVLDLGGAESHRTMHRGAAITECVVLDGPDGSALHALVDAGDTFDHVVAVCALSRVADVRATLAAVSAVLAADGRLHFVDPVATSSRVRTIGRFARPMVAVTSGFHLERNVVHEIRAAGFTICDLHRERSSVLRWPFQQVAWGSARRSLPAPLTPDATSDR